jgi:DNA-binding NarL/FixJ family response regulator
VEATVHADVSDLLPQIRVPTLVLHARNDAIIPFEWGREVAASVPGSLFVPLEGKNHYLLEQEPAWGVFLSEVRGFLATSARSGSAYPGGLSPREAEVLKLVAAGKSNRQIAEELTISINTADRHVSNILTKIDASNRAEAASFAVRHDLA